MVGEVDVAQHCRAAFLTHSRLSTALGDYDSHRLGLATKIAQLTCSFAMVLDSGHSSPVSHGELKVAVAVLTEDEKLML